MKRRFQIAIVIALMFAMCVSSTLLSCATINNSNDMLPFWTSSTMYNECVTFEESANGIYGTTLFVPTEIVSVYDNSMKTEYKAGKDFKWIKGTNRIEWLEGSSIPYFYDGALMGKESSESDTYVKECGNDGFDATGRCRLAGVLYCIGSFVYEKQFYVTYKYNKNQTNYKNILKTSYQGDKLPLTEEKLKNNSDLNVLFYGDSIFEGCDASSKNKREPYMPTMDKLIQTELQKKTTGNVTMTNLAVGGWAVEHGLWALSGYVGDKNFSDCLDGYDLLILSFGMNNGGTSPDSFKQTTKAIVDKLRQHNPALEVILVSCMNPNPECSYYGAQYQFGAKLEELATEDAHTAFVDFFAVHESILKYKSYSSTTGNNINHPNDWLIRLYAQNILASIIDYEDVTATPITVPPTSIKSLKAWRKTISASWTKRSARVAGKHIDGYQLQYSRSSTFKSCKTCTIKGYKNVTKKISNLKSGKKYYLRVRSYVRIDGKKYYSKWSKTKSVKLKI